MDKEILIYKWLNNELDAKEMEAFNNLEERDALLKLSEHMKAFKAPHYDEDQELRVISQRIRTKTQSVNWMKPLLRIAALVIITLGGFWFINRSTDITTSTLISEKTSVELPDASYVTLNSKSVLTYSPKNWDKNRTVALEGEAFFDVAKGATFDVYTEDGVVTVLGTEFNVKQRDDYFEVICYEGRVAVTYKNEQIKELGPGDGLMVIDDAVKHLENVLGNNPSWMENESQFRSTPYKLVLREFERQYDINFTTSNVDLEQLFTGNFSHNDFQIALKAITLPLNLNYRIDKNTVTLFSDQK